MNKKIYIIFFVLIWFILNIFFYLLSDNYRYFLQSLKYDNKEYKIDDKFKIEIPDVVKNEKNNSKDNIFSWLSENFGETKKEVVKKTNIETKDKKAVIVNIDTKQAVLEDKAEFVNYREKIKLTNIENNILEKLKKYKLKKVDLHPRLFDLTWEYPDEYFEYYSPDINLYFFWNKSYIDLRDIFEVLTYELPFKIKEVNNFWTKSFYINLDWLFEDDYIRIVIEKSNRTFWIKIKKELYNKIKNDLAIIFKK